MTSFDRLLIEPTCRELADSLREAVRFAESTFEIKLSGLIRAANRLESTSGLPESREGFEAPPLTAKHDAANPVAMAWWTDPFGQRHYRVMVRHEAISRWDWVRSMPALWYVYPDRLCLRTRNYTVTDLLAACGCGVCGRPIDLAWTGPRCGPCADHRAERIEAGLPFDERPSVLRSEHSLHWLTFSSDASILAGLDSEQRIIAWDVQTARPAWTEPDILTRCVAFAPAGDWLVAFNESSELCIVDARTGRIRRVLGSDLEWLPIFRFSPDGRWFAIGERHGVLIHTVSKQSDTLVAEQQFLERELRPYCLRFSPDGTRLFVATRDELVCLACDSPNPLWRRNCGNHIDRLDVSPDSQQVAIQFTDRIELISTVNGAQEALIATGSWISPSQGLAFHPRLRHIVSASPGGVCLWSLSTRALSAEFKAQPQGITAMALSTDGRTLATAATDGTARLWPWEDLLLV